MRLRLDEMVPVQIARELRHEGFDVDAVAEQPPLRGLPDHEQLARAAADERAIVTYDAGDYLPLAAQRSASGAGHGGLVLLRSDRFPQGDPARIVRGLSELLADVPGSAVVSVHWLEI